MVQGFVTWLAVGSLLMTATGRLPQGQPVTGGTLLATVVDARGQSHVDLNIDDFVVSEDGQDRDVLDVHVADYPIALLLDDTRNLATSVAIRDAAVDFIERIGDRPLAVAVLSSDRETLANFDDERAAILTRIRSAPIQSDRPPAALPALAHTVGLIRDLETPFSVIVVITATAIDPAQVTDTALLAEALATKSVIHVVTLQPSTVAQPPRGSDLLRELSDETHGQYTPIFSAASYRVALNRLADRLSTEMMVEYLVPPDGATGNVQVGVRRPGLRVLGRGVNEGR